MSEQELQESLQLQRSLDKLAECEREMSVADRDVEIFRLKRTHKVFEVRKEILKNISIPLLHKFHESRASQGKSITKNHNLR